MKKIILIILIGLLSTINIAYAGPTYSGGGIEKPISGNTCSTSYTPNMKIGDTYTLTLNGSACEVMNPTNLTAGMGLSIYFTQSNTVAPTFDTAYKWASGTAPTFSTSATKYDAIGCFCYDGSTLVCGSIIDAR